MWREIVSPANDPVTDPAQFLRGLFDVAVDAAYPKFQPHHLAALDINKPALVIGAGKAAASMAKAFEQVWVGPMRGLVITRRGYGLETSHIEVTEADHPFPTQTNIEATNALLKVLETRGSEEQLIFLVSGGASSLLCKPIDGVTLEDKRAISSALMNSGADIREINCVRRHLSAVKGGGLSSLCGPRTIHTFAISDVVGDAPVDIGSGPTVNETTAPEHALEVLRRYHISLGPTVEEALKRTANIPGAGGDETALPYVFLGKPSISLEAAADYAKKAGVHPVILGDDITGEARDVGIFQARLATDFLDQKNTENLPCVLLSGGEATVTKKGTGKGGPNTEYLAAFMQQIAGHPAIFALAADTDGIDGSQDNAGAVVTPDTWQKMCDSGLDVEAFLRDNDCYSLFQQLDSLLITGPTFTNVNDFRAVYISP